jgi:iron complex outermembrane receptor protein
MLHKLLVLLHLLLVLCPALMFGQTTGSIRGVIAIKETGGPLHDATVVIVELNRTTRSGNDGTFEFRDVPLGRYHLTTHVDSLFNQSTKLVDVEAGTTANVNLMLEISKQRYAITVTGSDKQETTFESFSSVSTLDSFDLASSRDVSLGETLDHKVGTGIAKRGFGPGAARPIIRGFDGDRVLIMEDGIRTGSLSSQSGDHGEMVNPSQLERLEIVKGPATLLYSGNAIGGTVNAISRHHELHQHFHEGLRGFISGSGGTNNALGGGSAGVEYGVRNWMMWASAAGMRSGDFHTPIGEIFNSRTRTVNGNAGLGWFTDRQFFSIDFKADNALFGVPFAQELHAGEDEHEGEEDHEEGEEHEHEDIERVSLDSRRQNYRFSWGLRNLPWWVQGFTLKLNYTDWAHDELETFTDGDEAVGTAFRQGQFIYRGVFEQAQRGHLSGRFGFWGIHRDYDVRGEEALAPPVDQTGFAVFGLEELSLERWKLQFGGRLETQRYKPGRQGYAERSFTGGSAAAGVHVDLWRNGAFVANYAHSYRAPALEELYNFGAHVGNLAFEIGDSSLRAEAGNGMDFSLRHRAERLHATANFYYYDFDNFVFPFFTGEREDGLQVIQYTQRPARYTGAEADFNLLLHPHLWLNLGFDVVDARATDTQTPLPRIPPVRGKVGLEFKVDDLRISPELILADRKSDIYPGERPTAGYAVMNLKASYTVAQTHWAHQFAVNVFNLGDQLYRNHSSFIKDLAPEIGRGVRFTYTARFF